MFYIQMRYDGELETVDEFSTRWEARKMLAEYMMLGHAEYYISTRPCNEWKDRP